MVDLRHRAADVAGRSRPGIRAERVVRHDRRHRQGRIEQRPSRRDGHRHQSSAAGRAARSSVRRGRQLQVRRPASRNVSAAGRAHRILDVGSRGSATDRRLQRARRSHVEARRDGRSDHRQRAEPGRRRHQHGCQRRVHEGSSRFDSARPRSAEHLCHGARRDAGDRRRRRQHDGAAAEPVQLRRVVAAEAAGRRHEHHDGRGPEHRHLLQRQHPRRGADQDVG